MDAPLKNQPIVTVAAASHMIHGDEQHSEPLKNLMKVIELRREKAHLAHAWWRWLMTAQGWTSEYEARDF